MYTNATRGFAMPLPEGDADGDPLAAVDADADPEGDADGDSDAELLLLPLPHADSTAAIISTRIVPSDHDLFILFIHFLPDSLFSSSWPPRKLLSVSSEPLDQRLTYTILSDYFSVNFLYIELVLLMKCTGFNCASCTLSLFCVRLYDF